MILKTSLRAKAGVPKTLVKQRLHLHSVYFPQNTLMSTESRGEFSDLHSIFRLLALRHSCEIRRLNIKSFSNLRCGGSVAEWLARAPDLKSVGRGLKSIFLSRQH